MITDWTETCRKCADGEIEPKECEYYGEPGGCNSPTYGEHPTPRRKFKDLFETYDQARSMYYDTLVPEYGCTRMEWGFGRWLWLDFTEREPRVSLWQRMDDLGILTAAGRKMLERAKKAKGGEA